MTITWENKRIDFKCVINYLSDFVYSRYIYNATNLKLSY